MSSAKSGKVMKRTTGKPTEGTARSASKATGFPPAENKVRESRLRAVWDNPTGWRYWTSVNNYQVGLSPSCSSPAHWLC
jgi:hypothetical protein